MGLFGSKKPGYKLVDFYTIDELKTIRATIAPKLEAGQYIGIPLMFGKALLDLINRAGNETSYSKQGKFMKIAESFKEFEPDLAPILQSGIDKYRMAGR